ncbi:MAG: hypothetical protein KAS75_03065 [Planctomycetes bacterium]|nr:hypothetical protein [Planctomycetota bacterium]
MGTGAEKGWLLPVFIVLAVLCLIFTWRRSDSPASVQAKPQVGSDEHVLVVPIQIDRDSYGLAMVDMVGQTLWVYGLSSTGPAHSRLKLIAARSWQYDKLLQQYNTAEPKPEQVKFMLESLGRQQELTPLKTVGPKK